MRALSLTQPWATLVAIGQKRIETRSWSTSYRGVLAIHAAKGYPKWARETCAEEPFYSVLQAHGEQWVRDHAGQSPRSVFEDPVLPLGMIVAVARLTAVMRTEAIELAAGAVGGLLPHELEFGDFSEGRFGWLLSDVQKLPTPVECKGALGLWAVPVDIRRGVLDQAPDFRRFYRDAE